MGELIFFWCMVLYIDMYGTRRLDSRYQEMERNEIRNDGSRVFFFRSIRLFQFLCFYIRAKLGTFIKIAEVFSNISLVFVCMYVYCSFVE